MWTVSSRFNPSLEICSNFRELNLIIERQGKLSNADPVTETFLTYTNAFIFLQAILPPFHPRFEPNLKLGIESTAGRKVYNSTGEAQKWNYSFILIFLSLGTTSMGSCPLYANHWKGSIHWKQDLSGICFLDGVSTALNLTMFISISWVTNNPNEHTICR
jgi:hypothetical protein